MSSNEITAVQKSAQSIYNRSMPRDAAADLATRTAAYISEHFGEFVTTFGTADPFDLGELVALATIKAM